jgi:hypothetical protein
LPCAETIVGQLLGGLAIELQKQLPQFMPLLSQLFDEPAIRISNMYMIDGEFGKESRLSHNLLQQLGLLYLSIKYQTQMMIFCCLCVSFF